MQEEILSKTVISCESGTYRNISRRSSDKSNDIPGRYVHISLLVLVHMLILRQNILSIQVVFAILQALGIYQQPWIVVDEGLNGLIGEQTNIFAILCDANCLIAVICQMNHVNSVQVCLLPSCR